MDNYLRPGLSPSEASEICMNQCRAKCCRGAWILSLSQGEAQVFEAKAEELGVETLIRPAGDGGGWIRFTDHSGERCPMLDPTTFACRIYDSRPQRCRSFPEQLTPGCAISGG